MEPQRDGSDEDLLPSTSPAARAERIEALRARIVLPDAASCPLLPLGVPLIDWCLPGGLGLGLPHEVVPDGPGDEAASLGFALALVARRLAEATGEALLVLAPGHPLPYGHGLAGLGLDPERLLILEVGSEADVFRALEAALQSRALRAVAGLVSEGLPLIAGRRLRIVGGDALLLVLRPTGAEQPNGAATRWRIAAAPAARDCFGHPVAPRWRLRLDRCRNGRTGTWIVEWDRAARRFGLAERLAGHASAAGGRRS
ncbi:ImuA family protein [Methylobacterium radiodurans]|uniref:ImuA protein n=1 Tax=Methylobacterium radiodurans TaxID=2202828 RepID=A0A2U8W1N8_9HYPH|nr:ImuA protein [Methylobacterium radiodurans]AWN39186.1 ImuA protein [Methylobacterium radiodurans]